VCVCGEKLATYSIFGQLECEGIGDSSKPPCLEDASRMIVGESAIFLIT
jgi:hypothetical protein